MSQTKPAVVGVGKVKEDRVLLRWNVNNYLLFQQLVLQGVLIDRQELDAENKPLGNWTRITPDTLRALPLAAFNQPQMLKDTAKLIIAQCIYGKASISKGSLIENMKQQDEEMENKYAILTIYSSMRPENAVIAGLGFIDRIKPDTAKNYAYRIIPCTHNGYRVIDTGFIKVRGKDMLFETHLLAPFAEGFDKKILLTWPATANASILGYYFERSADTGRVKKYHLLNQQPYLPRKDSLNGQLMYSYIDSVENKRNYFYHIYGIDAFGDSVGAEYPVFAHARDLTPPAPLELSFTLKDKNVTFKWNRSKDGDLKTILLAQGKTSRKIDSILSKQPISPADLSYSIQIDERKMSSGYFRLVLIDSNGNYSYSNHVYVFIADKTPPAKPYGLAGNIDSLGAVHINWMPDSLEALRGYKILMSNDEQHFVNLTDALQDTAYTYSTTMATLSKDIYFKIVAIDGSFNHSEPSEVLHLKRPLKIKPLRPVFIDMKAGISGVNLNWSDSHSEDFAFFNLYKRKAGDAKWGLLSKVSTTYFRDTAILPEHGYEYTVQEVSNQNIYSDSAFPVLATIGKATPQNDIQLKQSRNEEQKKYVLSWAKPAKNVSFYLVYRDSGKGLTMYRSVSGNELTFSDNITSDKELHYSLEVHYADHTVSEIINAQ